MLPRWIQLPPLVPLLLVPLLVSACGDSSDASQDSNAGTAAMEVTQVFEPQMPYGEEGALSFALIEGDGGTVAQADGIQPHITGVTPLLSEQLANGSYRVSSYQRTCGPSSCDQEPGLSSLDPPSVRCSADFEVREQEPVNVVVTVEPVRGTCTILVGVRAGVSDLSGTTFVATALSENGGEMPILPVREALDLPTGTRIMVAFDLHEPDVLSWAGGCNETWSDLQVTDERLMVEDKFGSTLVGCEGPLGEQEVWLTRFLLSDPEWTLDGDRLTLQSGDSTIELLRVDQAE